MAVLKINDIRSMNDNDLIKKIDELKKEYLVSDDNPGRRKEIKRAIARIYTVLRERELGINISEAPEQKQEQPKEKQESSKQ